jgi:hypothetical protein
VRTIEEGIQAFVTLEIRVVNGTATPQDLAHWYEIAKRVEEDELTVGLKAVIGIDRAMITSFPNLMRLGLETFDEGLYQVREGGMRAVAQDLETLLRGRISAEVLLGSAEVDDKPA